jgi:hypothetical protein
MQLLLQEGELQTSTCIWAWFPPGTHRLHGLVTSCTFTRLWNSLTQNNLSRRCIKRSEHTANWHWAIIHTRWCQCSVMLCLVHVTQALSCYQWDLKPAFCMEYEGKASFQRNPITVKAYTAHSHGNILQLSSSLISQIWDKWWMLSHNINMVSVQSFDGPSQCQSWSCHILGWDLSKVWFCEFLWHWHQPILSQNSHLTLLTATLPNGQLVGFVN